MLILEFPGAMVPHIGPVVKSITLSAERGSTPGSSKSYKHREFKPRAPRYFSLRLRSKGLLVTLPLERSMSSTKPFQPNVFSVAFMVPFHDFSTYVSLSSFLHSS